VRVDTGGIDWDRITRAFDRRFQRRWVMPHRRGTAPYRNSDEADIVLSKYEDKLYTFLTPDDRKDDDIRDEISIALVRVAQKGNVTARQKIVELLRFTVDEWIEGWPRISRWRGNGEKILKRIEGCIRCYRYSGSFMGYLFRTLEYAARGLRPIHTCSLEDSLPFGYGRRIDSCGYDPDTGELLIYRKKMSARHDAV
jgi:hypothetical protein